MSLDSWALDCSGLGYTLFQNRMSSSFKEPTASLGGDPELQDLRVTHSSPFSTWLSVLFFVSSASNTALSEQSCGVLLMVAETLSS